MGIEYVKSVREMKMANVRFFSRVKSAQGTILNRLAQLNLEKSQDIVKDDAYWRGTLLSMIKLNRVDELNFHVLSSAPHSYSIEKGIPPVRVGWVNFSEQPGLEEWVATKLMGIDPDKARFFLRVGRAKVGEKGFPYGFPKGVRFMELGFEFARYSSYFIIE